MITRARHIASPARPRGPLPRTPPRLDANRSAAAKSSATGPREAVPLDGRAQRSYPRNPTSDSPAHRARRFGRSIKASDAPHYFLSGRGKPMVSPPSRTDSVQLRRRDRQ